MLECERGPPVVLTRPQEGKRQRLRDHPPLVLVQRSERSSIAYEGLSRSGGDYVYQPDLCDRGCLCHNKKKISA